MTVQDLIDALQATKDKTLPVTLSIEGVYNSGSNVGFGLLERVNVEDMTVVQDRIHDVPVITLTLFADDGLSEGEIVMMRNRELEPFASMWETSGVCAVLDKSDHVIKRYFLKDSDDYCELADDERDRLNAEYRKDQA